MTSIARARWIPESVVYTRPACEIDQPAARQGITYHPAAVDVAASTAVAHSSEPEPYDDSGDWAAPPKAFSDEAFAGVVAAPIVVGLVLAVVSGKAPYTGITHMIDSLSRFCVLVAAALVVGWVLLRPKAPPRRKGAMTGRAARVHAHGNGVTRSDIGRHEGGHAVAARVLGGFVRRARMFPGLQGGVVQATLPNPPRVAIAFLHAGQAAMGSRTGAHLDDAAITKISKEIPWRDRAAEVRAGRADGDRIVRQHRGEIERYGKRLERKGTLRG